MKKEKGLKIVLAWEQFRLLLKTELLFFTVITNFLHVVHKNFIFSTTIALYKNIHTITSVWIILMEYSERNRLENNTPRLSFELLQLKLLQQNGTNFSRGKFPIKIEKRDISLDRKPTDSRSNCKRTLPPSCCVGVSHR